MKRLQSPEELQALAQTAIRHAASDLEHQLFHIAWLELTTALRLIYRLIDIKELDA